MLQRWDVRGVYVQEVWVRLHTDGGMCRQVEDREYAWVKDVGNEQKMAMMIMFFFLI